MPRPGAVGAILVFDCEANKFKLGVTLTGGHQAPLSALASEIDGWRGVVPRARRSHPAALRLSVAADAAARRGTGAPAHLRGAGAAPAALVAGLPLSRAKPYGRM